MSNKKEGTTGFYYYIDESTQEIVITNYQEIEPSYIFTCDVVYHSTNGSNISADREYPSAIRDKYRKEFEADVVLTLGDQTPVSANTDSIAVQYNTDAKISGFQKLQIQIYQLSMKHGKTYGDKTS